MANRNLIAITVCVLLLLLPVSCINVPSTIPTTTTPTTPMIPTLTYENSAYGITIQYPQDWTKWEEPGSNVIVMFIPPGESPSDIPMDKFGIVFTNLSQPRTLDEYTQGSLQLIGKLFPGYQLIESTPTTLAGNPAHKIVYTAKAGQDEMEIMNVYTIKNNKVYLLGYNVLASRYSDFIGSVQQMIDSFEIK